MVNIFFKLFLYCILLTLCVYCMFTLSLFYSARTIVSVGESSAVYIKNSEATRISSTHVKNIENNKVAINKEILQMKYILLWTSPKDVPFVYMGNGQSGFIDRKCPYINCFVTSDRNYFDSYTKFDVIAFSGPQAIRMPYGNLPSKRSPHQKFAFASIESAANYPLCNNNFDGFFNWTWTYRLDSEARWGYIVVRDIQGKIIGPNKIMHWIDINDMDPINIEMKYELQSKSKAAAWFVSNCRTQNNREKYVKELQKELDRYNLTVDIFGSCGPMKCDRSKSDQCNKLIHDQYYFYLSFENSFAEDYVTEKLLNGLKNYAVPIVFGGANYTRFMPDGIYLNAVELGPSKLAATMNELINDRERYEQFFKWRNHYSYHRRIESIETDDYCRFCSMLNDKELVSNISVYKKFKEWWTPPDYC